MTNIQFSVSIRFCIAALNCVFEINSRAELFGWWQVAIHDRLSLQIMRPSCRQLRTTIWLQPIKQDLWSHYYCLRCQATGAPPVFAVACAAKTGGYRAAAVATSTWTHEDDVAIISLPYKMCFFLWNTYKAPCQFSRHTLYTKGRYLSPPLLHTIATQNFPWQKFHDILWQNKERAEEVLSVCLYSCLVLNKIVSMRGNLSSIYIDQLLFLTFYS